LEVAPTLMMLSAQLDLAKSDVAFADENQKMVPSLLACCDCSVWKPEQFFGIHIQTNATVWLHVCTWPASG